MTVKRVWMMCVRVLRPPLTAKALHGWACPRAITITDDAFNLDGCEQ